jgi:hypothetical protein
MAKSNKDIEDKSAELRVLRSEFEELNREISKAFSSTSNFYDNSSKEVQESLKKCLEILKVNTQNIDTGNDFLKLLINKIQPTNNFIQKIFYKDKSKGRNLNTLYRSYLVSKFGKKFKRDYPHTSCSLIECEIFLFQKISTEAFKSMKWDDVAKIVEYCKSETKDKSMKPSIVIASLFGTAKLSGFGLYTSASTILSSIGSTVGVTFPFAIYTGLSSFISVLLGPVGLSALAASFLIAISPSRSSINNAILAIICIKMQRYSKFVEKKEKLEEQIKMKEEELSELRFKDIQSRGVRSILKMLLWVIIFLIIFGIIKTLS